MYKTKQNKTKQIINNHNRRLLLTTTDNSPSPTVTKNATVASWKHAL